MKTLHRKTILEPLKRNMKKNLNPIQSYIPERSPKHLLFYMHTLIMETKDRIALVKESSQYWFPNTSK